jgi:hypothetical protein
MGALTPARLTRGQPFTEQVPLLDTVQPSLHSVTKHLVRPVIASMLPAQRDRLPDDRSDGFALSVIRSGLRLKSAGSSQHTAESCFSSYGLLVRLRLLPTPPHGDAVTFGYREGASPARGLAPLSLRLLAGARIPAFAGMTVEVGVHVRHAGESRHPGVFPIVQVLNLKKCSFNRLPYLLYDNKRLA